MEAPLFHDVYLKVAVYFDGFEAAPRVRALAAAARRYERFVLGPVAPHPDVGVVVIGALFRVNSMPLGK